MTTKDQEFFKAVRFTSLFLAALAVITWLVCAVIIHNFKDSNTSAYAQRYERLNVPQKAICTGLEATGSVEKSVGSAIGGAFSSKRKKSDSFILDAISNNHKSPSK